MSVCGPSLDGADRGSCGAAVVFAALALTACAEPSADEPPSAVDPLTDIAFPPGEACDAVDAWPAARVQQELRLLGAVMDLRAQAGKCPGGSHFARTDVLRTEGALVCAARRFAEYVADSGKLGHTDGDGDTVVDRLADAGWDSPLATELVAAADIDPERVVSSLWLPSATHCNAMRARAWTHVGVAYVERQPPDPADDSDSDSDSMDPEAPVTSAPIWVLVLSAPPP